MKSNPTIQQRLDELFKSLDQGRRSRLTGMLTPLTRVFTEAGFTVGYSGIGTDMSGHDAMPRAFEPSGKSLPRHERARYMGHVIEQARNTPPTIVDRWTRQATPRYEVLTLRTEIDSSLGVTLGRDTLREAVFMHMHRGNDTLNVTLSTTGPRQVETSYRGLQARWAEKLPVDIAAEFLMTAKSPAFRIFTNAVAALIKPEKETPPAPTSASPWSSTAYTASKRAAADQRMMGNQPPSNSSATPTPAPASNSPSRLNDGPSFWGSGSLTKF